MATYRVYSVNEDGERQVAEFKSAAALMEAYESNGIEQDSYSIRLHGEPMLKGFVGPMSEGKGAIRYELPKLFVAETEEWAKAKRGKAEAVAAE